MPQRYPATFRSVRIYQLLLDTHYQLDNPNLQTVQAAPKKDTTYLCTATKSRGCQVLDSIHIQVKDLPQHFLSPSQPACLNNQVLLQPIGQWIAYKWFDNSTEPTITVNDPGTYALEVTDTSSCRGRDSITVIPGYCNPGIYFPNAFSPDGNGTNDFFRPVVTVPLDAFYLVVFNREGQKMFETKDYTHGWDGRSMGHKLGADSFVWYAQYHIHGQLRPAYCRQRIPDPRSLKTRPKIIAQTHRFTIQILPPFHSISISTALDYSSSPAARR